MNLARTALAGSGIQTAALGFGGQNFSTSAITGLTEDWNGVSWQETADLNTARYYLTGAGTSSSALAALGKTNVPAGETGATEEWNSPSNTVKTLTD